MLYRKSHLKKVTRDTKGFTLIELMVVITLAAIISTTAYTFFNTSFSGYIALQENSVQFGELAQQSQRITNVLRGLTDITAVSADDITLYTYFSPRDNTVSLTRYYKSADKKTLYADVTPMTANPPNGTPITASKKTYTVIESLYAIPNTSTFVYLDSSGATMNLPITDLHTIKGIRVNLGVPSRAPTANNNETISLQVSLRNRKTNL